MRHAKELIVSELKKDKEMRIDHLSDAIESLVSGDTRTGLLMLRNLVNATCGFPKMSEITEIPEKSIMRMLSVRGNPNTSHLFKVIKYLEIQDGVHLAIAPGKRAAG